ncbi:hypothetical protein H6P81_014115 [Aristolochia fimbriata]|uniref:Uncharacterized protein n=1 Tax=Aristolochia fimbriata TaxID=158543 RepID=A0AAV7EK96_ARIFI|nr:hypothetical protein H6P81_014115 [Aristolochia fimbriata]
MRGDDSNHPGEERNQGRGNGGGAEGHRSVGHGRRRGQFSRVLPYSRSTHRRETQKNHAEDGESDGHFATLHCESANGYS